MNSLWLELKCQAIVAISITALLFASSTVAQDPQRSNQPDALAHLNAVISWYKNLTSTIQPGQQPSDSIYLSNAENLGAQAVRLAFQSAKAQVALNSKTSDQVNSAAEASVTNVSAQKYAQLESEISQRITDDQSQIDALKRQTYAQKKAGSLAEQQQALEGKLALDKASLDAIGKMKKFVDSTNSEGTGLEGSINELARAVPEVFGTSSDPKTNNAVQEAKSPAPTPGLLGQVVSLYGLMQKIRSIDELLEETARVQKLSSDLRQPLRQELVATLQQGKSLATQNGIPKKDYDNLTQKFNEISSALLPLSQEIVILDQSRSNLLEWKRSFTNESEATLRSLLIRVAGILIALAAIVGLAEVWRKLTFRYVHDPRRRRQFLILRRFVMGFLISLVIVLGFISEFSSLATFAGFVTAGIAVGLQAVLLSVAAYFLVMGRYGIRVGDRVTVAGVTGDVIEVGLIRLYLMELAGTSASLYSTGRIAVFSNSVLFQPTTPLFKQLPGTQYAWHEVVLPLAPAADYKLLQETLSSAVGAVYKEYENSTNSQNGMFGNSMEITITPPKPETRLQFADAGLELVGRYPVDLHRASEMDEKLADSLMNTIQCNEKIASSIAGTPKIRAAVKG